MTKMIKVLEFDSEALVGAVSGIELYRDLREEFDGSPHKDVFKAWIRKPKFDTAECCQNSDETVDVIHDDIIKGFICYVKGALDYSIIGRVIVVNLPQGGVIDKHRDEGSYPQEYSRFNAVIKGCCLWIGEDEGYLMEEGNLYLVPNLFEHKVIGIRDRLSLIFDMTGDDCD